MVALGREIHARGLKFGLCLSPGRRTCAMIYARYPGEALGSYGHEQLDADTFAEWGVDYLKYDWCRANSGGTHLHEADAFASMAAALKRAGRPTVYSMLWAMLAAPLMAGNDVRAMSEATRALLTDPEIISISQDPAGVQGARVERMGKLEFWRRPLSDGHAIGVLNRGRSQVTLPARAQDFLAASGSGAVDISSGATDRFDVVLAPHEMRLWRVRKAQ